MLDDVAVVVSIAAGGTTVSTGLWVLYRRIRDRRIQAREQRQADRELLARLENEISEMRKLVTELIDRTPD